MSSPSNTAYCQSPLPGLTFPVKCFGQAPSLHKGRVILTNRATELGSQWKSDDDVQDSPPNKQQPPLPKQLLKWSGSFCLVDAAFKTAS